MSLTQKEKFQELLGDFNTAVLITHDGKNSIRARPMAIAAVDENCDLWFITGKDSAKVHEIERDTHVHIVCQDGWSSCVSITGRASVVTDRNRLQSLWNAYYQVWFPEGINSPEIVLIHVVGEQGEYWDNTGANRFTYLFQAAKAMVTGTTPEIEEGEQHGRVNFAR